jgi:conjugative transposon TraM protein
MKRTQKYLEQRKFLMALPLLVLPFLTATFWALGGGSGTPADPHAEQLRGLNLDLPPAHFSEEQLDKLSLYETARRDSMKFREARQNDPYFNLDNLPVSQPGVGQTDPNETLVNNKLAELYQELSRKPEKNTPAYKEHAQSMETNEEVNKLSGMMEMMQSRRKPEVDPEESRINTMLDKILDVQHPERVKEKLRERSSLNKSQVFAVTTTPNPEVGTDAFFGLENESAAQDSAGNAIEAVIHNTQELVAGSIVKMRLLSQMYVGGKLIPKDQFVFGVAAMNGERLTIAISTIRSETSLFPVSLAAYDLDGLEGIYIPGAITRDAAKQSSDQAMQSMQFMTMDQSVGAQASAAGIQAAKGLFSKKVKMVKVTVKAGYKILLRDGNVK